MIVNLYDFGVGTRRSNQILCPILNDGCNALKQRKGALKLLTLQDI
jgi:hypothetical protein